MATGCLPFLRKLSSPSKKAKDDYEVSSASTRSRTLSRDMSVVGVESSLFTSGKMSRNDSFMTMVSNSTISSSIKQSVSFNPRVSQVYFDKTDSPISLNTTVTREYICSSVRDTSPVLPNGMGGRNPFIRQSQHRLRVPVPGIHRVERRNCLASTPEY